MNNNRGNIYHLIEALPKEVGSRLDSDIVISSRDVTNDNGLNCARFAGGRRCMIFISNVGRRGDIGNLEACLSDFQDSFSIEHPDCHVQDAFRVLPMSSDQSALVIKSMMIEAFVTPLALQHGAVRLVDAFEELLKARFPKAAILRQDTPSPRASGARYVQHTRIIPVNRTVVGFSTGASEHEQ